MPLNADAKQENLKRSLDVWTKAALETTLALPVDYGEGGFDDSQRSEWAQTALLGPVRPAFGVARRVTASARGQLLALIFQVNIFVRPGKQTVMTRLYGLADAVRGVLTETTKIEVKNYVGDSASLGKLIVRRIVMDREVPAGDRREELQQWLLSTELHWVETFSAA